MPRLDVDVVLRVGHQRRITRPRRHKMDVTGRGNTLLGHETDRIIVVTEREMTPALREILATGSILQFKVTSPELRLIGPHC